MICPGPKTGCCLLQEHLLGFVPITYTNWKDALYIWESFGKGLRLPYEVPQVATDIDNLKSVWDQAYVVEAFEDSGSSCGSQIS